MKASSASNLRVIMFGPPGAGKGTQASRIAETLVVPRVSSGDLFRDHQNRETELGNLAKSYMERGILVPDDLTIRMVMEWIEAHKDRNGFILDGFPRTHIQAEALDEAMTDQGGIDRALNIDVGKEELVRRLTGRIVCKKCQAIYHLVSSPPRRDSECDSCGSALRQRDDDKAASVEKRLDVYFEETEPLVEYYRQLGKLRQVSGEGSVDEVSGSIMVALST